MRSSHLIFHVCTLALAALSVGVGAGFHTSAVGAPNAPAAANTASGATVPPPPQNISNTAEPLAGTLFFNREQRERIDRARKQGNVVEVTEEIVTAQPRRPVINGFVKRSDGANVVWINGERMNLTAGSADSVSATDVGSSAALQRVQFTRSSGESPKQIQPAKKTSRKAVKKTKQSAAQKVKKAKQK